VKLDALGGQKPSAAPIRSCRCKLTDRSSNTVLLARASHHERDPAVLPIGLKYRCRGSVMPAGSPIDSLGATARISESAVNIRLLWNYCFKEEATTPDLSRASVCLVRRIAARAMREAPFCSAWATSRRPTTATATLRAATTGIASREDPFATERGDAMSTCAAGDPVASHPS